VINRFAEGGTIVVAPEETLRSAFARMRAADVSQLPVIENGQLVGLIDESDLLDRLVADPRAFETKVRDAMSAHLKTVRASAPVKELMPLFAENYVPVVVDNDHFLGLITRIDLINELRKNPQ
jgi:cystathionine beta-synthase